MDPAMVKKFFLHPLGSVDEVYSLIGKNGQNCGSAAGDDDAGKIERFQRNAFSELKHKLR